MCIKINFNKHMKRCIISFIIKKMKTKTIMRYHFTITRMAIIKKDS